MTQEFDRIRERYRKRDALGCDGAPYSLIWPDRYMTQQEKERSFLVFLKPFSPEMIARMKVLEVGCGRGQNIQQLLRWGFSPENITANDLLPERCSLLRTCLPPVTTVLEGDALSLPLAEESFDIVLISTVFTSILDESFRTQLADKVWSWVKPGGGVLWYDFVYDNPWNPDVKAVTRKRLLELFPEAKPRTRRVTLAPPLARVLCRICPGLYSFFNCLPLLRTHCAAWLGKPGPKPEDTNSGKQP